MNVEEAGSWKGEVAKGNDCGEKPWGAGRYSDVLWESLEP